MLIGFRLTWCFLKCNFYCLFVAVIILKGESLLASYFEWNVSDGASLVSKNLVNPLPPSAN